MSMKARLRSLFPLGLLAVVGCFGEPPVSAADPVAAPEEGPSVPPAAVMPYQEAEPCHQRYPQLAKQTTPISVGGRTTQIEYKLGGNGNRLRIAQGDMIVGLEGGNRSGSGTSSGVGIVDLGKLWPNGRVPYVFEGLDAALKDRVVEAMQQWQSQTPIRFIPRTTEGDYARIVPMPEGAEGSCFSFPGRLGQPQDVYLGLYCSTGNIAHELGHLIGLFHEQARSDRDKYVEILYDNIMPSACREFQTIDGIPEAANIGSYDFGSLMHYAADAFAKASGTVTIKARAGVTVPPGVQMGQRNRPSSGDLAAVRKMYSAK